MKFRDWLRTRDWRYLAFYAGLVILTIAFAIYDATHLGGSK